METMNITWVRSVCLLGAGPQVCRFLMMGPGNWICAKSPGKESLRAQIDAKSALGTMIAIGDNCEGFEIVQARAAAEAILRSASG